MLESAPAVGANRAVLSRAAEDEECLGDFRTDMTIRWQFHLYAIIRIKKISTITIQGSQGMQLS